MSTNFYINIGKVRLEEVSSHNYLGVILDNKLVFDGFLKGKCNKINVRLHQLGKMRKCITCNIANLIYKQALVPLFDYGDFLIESGHNVYIERLNALHSKALRSIDCKVHGHASYEQLDILYGLLSPIVHRREHHCVIMYRLSHIRVNLDVHRPKINLHSRKVLKKVQCPQVSNYGAIYPNQYEPLLK